MLCYHERMSRHGAQLKLLDTPVHLPNGLLYRPDFITPAEEDILLAHIENLSLRHPVYEEAYEAKRRVKSFGWKYDFEKKKLIPGKELPSFLKIHARKIAKWMDIPASRVVHALVTEYTPGSAIDWHTDTEEFEHVVGVSLNGWANMRFRPWRRKGERSPKDIVALDLEPRSCYIMQGSVRWRWQHSVAPTKTLRYSITFRTLMN